MYHPDLVSGMWTGFYNYEAGGERHPTDLTLTFVRGIIAGQGQDETGVYGIAGCYDESADELTWTKTYFGRHSVRYRGFQDRGGIWGTWEIADGPRGGFQMWPSIENAMNAVLVAKAKTGQQIRKSKRRK